jgi:ABC-type multidrug transport system fused ATPase/permease subunit
MREQEMSVNSIERLDEYCNIEQEAPAIVYTNRPPQSWPHEGAMTLRNVTLKYASSTEPVLHGISFNVPAHTSVGIVGKLQTHTTYNTTIYNTLHSSHNDPLLYVWTALR